MNYTEKREFFQKLTEVHSEKAKVWVRKDQNPKTGKNGEVESVFRHSISSKGIHLMDTNFTRSSSHICVALSLESVLKRMLVDTPATSNLSASLATSSDSVAIFLAEGIDIKVKQ
jgi:hypothetical protein